ANAMATFHGPDLVGFTNTLTGESYLRLPPSSPLMDMETLASHSQQLQASNWEASKKRGAAGATISLRDQIRSMTLSVTVDASSQEIVIRLVGDTNLPGTSAGFWCIAGLDLVAGHLVLPAENGIILDQKHPGTGGRLGYPGSWNAQMAVYESVFGSMLLYSTD